MAFKPEWMPKNASGTPIDPAEWNRNDGFSPGQAALLRVPGIDLDETDAVRLDDLGSYDDDDAPASNQGFHCGALLAAQELGLGITDAEIAKKCRKGGAR